MTFKRNLLVLCVCVCVCVSMCIGVLALILFFLIIFELKISFLGNGMDTQASKNTQARFSRHSVRQGLSKQNLE